jgi:hypothetical protein
VSAKDRLDERRIKPPHEEKTQGAAFFFSRSAPEMTTGGVRGTRAARRASRAGRRVPEPERRCSPACAFYKVAELARVGGMSTFRLLRLLRRNNVRFIRMGRAYLVSMGEIYRKMPPLWEGLVATEALRRGQRTLEDLE